MSFTIKTHPETAPATTRHGEPGIRVELGGNQYFGSVTLTKNENDEWDQWGDLCDWADGPVRSAVAAYRCPEHLEKTIVERAQGQIGGAS